MNGRYFFSCALVIRLEYPTAVDEQKLTDAVYAALGGREIPLIWNLRKGVRVPVADEANLLPQGRYGIPHPLLKADELERELLFRASADGEIREYLFPAVPDTRRESFRTLYRRRGRILFETDDAIIALSDRGFVSVPRIRLDPGRVLPLKAGLREGRKRARRGGTPLAILLTADSPAETAETVSRLVSLSERYRPRWIGLEELLEGADASGDRGEIPPGAREGAGPAGDPLRRFRRGVAWNQASEGRLFLLARDHHDEGAVRGGPEEIPRGLIAHMPGETSMEEPPLGVRFLAGDPSGLFLDGRPLTLPEAAAPRFKAASGSVELVRTGAFSFQDDPVRGLRDRIVLQSELCESGGELIRDYFFVDEDPRLCISIFVTYPRFRTDTEIEEFALCEIPLTRLTDSEEIAVDCLYPDGERAAARLRSPGRYLLFGTRFAFPLEGGTVFLEYADDGGEVRELPVELRADSGREGGTTLYLNPGGSYHRFGSSSISGLGQSFSLIMSAAEAEGAPSPAGTAPLRPYLERSRVFRFAAVQR